ncbi:MAG: hypothetical protein KBD01_11260 [Acidobacteria bacterium]|nr:hypothetical protein [Acidobacteriota bacterium]
MFRRISVIRSLFAAVVLVVPAVHSALPGSRFSQPAPRDYDPVVLTGSQLPGFLGRAIDDLAVFRFDPATLAFVPIPFQVDERVNHVFNRDTILEFTQDMYDVFGEDDGLLDAGDEVAFMYSDGGPRAQESADWPSLAEPLRFEIQILDPRPSANVPPRWAYVFVGDGLPRSDTVLVSWAGTNTSTMMSDQMELTFYGNWLLTQFRTVAPCGTGNDVIDRLKGRARTLGDRLEDEEGWDENSVYLGGRVGPIRAIRYVRGAESGVNTIHYDVMYRRFWTRVFDIRVHPLPEVWFYFDLLPRAGTVLYTNLVRQGLTVDGVPDPNVPQALPEWLIVKTQVGGYAMFLDAPQDPRVQEYRFHYRDDAGYDDEIPTNPGYTDRDDSAYGNHGFGLCGLSDCNVDPIHVAVRVYPFCASVGDAALGDAYQELLEYPLQSSGTPQYPQLSPVRDLALQRDARDVVLAWSAVPGAQTYRVYAAADASLPPSSWTLLGETANPLYRDREAGADPSPRTYSVVGLDGHGEGEW